METEEMTTNKRVLLFGKTGAGKSTIANALVTGGVEDEEFTIGHGVKGCTSSLKTSSGRGWTVTDTVGLGEAAGGTVSSEEAVEKITTFLENVKGGREGYSHLIYVKAANNRFDVMDENIWESFQVVFAGAEDVFTIIFTKEAEEWLTSNWDDLPDWVKNVGRENVLITDIPPVSKRRVQESRNKDVRKKSIEKLETDLLASFKARGEESSVPEINGMNDSDLKNKASSILDFLSRLVRTVADIASSVFTIFSVADSMGNVG